MKPHVWAFISTALRGTRPRGGPGEYAVTAGKLLEGLEPVMKAADAQRADRSAGTGRGSDAREVIN